ncbi:response regulator [Raoultibacter phocaeensis]|uniref:response regulator n=1 Tax=Raoultibacter phocaeensis TaxID=2479841 RepID=UPI00111942A7|nr:response regulator transcription factor [Raoultibacter phocaeensis]
MSTENAAIRVAIVDDDEFVRSSLATILSAERDIEVCATGSDGEEAARLFDEMAPDVLLMDIQMPGCDGLAGARRILGAHPEALIVFLTTFSDDEYIVEALRLGVRGYLIKQEVANIAPAIRSVAAGQSVLGGEIVGRVDSLMRDNHVESGAPGEADGGLSGWDAARAAGLSEREFEIVELIAQGFDNKEIAARAFMSEGTVRNHVSAILQKLALKNRTQLAVYYYRKLKGEPLA